MPDAQAEPSLSFGSQAAAYERGRPSYPPEAIDWLLPPGAHDVLDLGAAPASSPPAWWNADSMS